MWGLEKLKEWARPALEYSELVTIARYAPSAKQAKTQALRFTEEKCLEEEIAKACRWLMIIRRDYGRNSQEAFIASGKQNETRDSSPKEAKRMKKKGRYIYCPLHEKTQCGYWSTFGGHLDPFIKGFKKHVKKDHSELPAGLIRDVGGIIDRWIGDLMEATLGQEREKEQSE